MKVLFAGSFQPPTKGHTEIIRRAAGMFDEVIVAVMINAEKKSLIEPEERKRMLEKCVKDLGNVRVIHSCGLTAEVAVREGADALLRGVRDVADFEYERKIADVNRQINGIETVFLLAKPELAHVSSGIVRDLAAHSYDISGFVPCEIVQDIFEAIKKETLK